MSCIERMSIQGIRSFGIDDKDKQVITFFTPLTLILGPNGTGKTTIIECLKYMTTGDMPPGCSKGGAFIHDPKIAHERQVKGQIRLQFRDRADKKVVVTRSLEATQKMKKIEVRTLEGMITRLGNDGQKHSISSRCAEIDREMITSLGVSKAILENVIFCHQEDSCWPLSEGKVLKQKFDDIFASTRYTKVLDTIRKISKEQVTDIKLIEKELAYLRQNKEKAGQLRSDLAETEARYVASKESVNKIAEKLEPIQDRLHHLGSRYHEIVKLQTKIEKLAGEKKQMEKSAQELQDTIENTFEGSTEELKQFLRDFQANVQEKQDKLNKFERKQESFKEDIDKLSEEKSNVLLRQGKLEEEAKRNEQNTRKRERMVNVLAEESNIEGFAGSIQSEDVKSFMDRLKQKAENVLEDAKLARSKFEEKEEDLQRQIDDLRSTKSKLEENEKMKTDMMVKNKTEIRNINQELSRVDASSERLEGLTRELRRVTKDLQEAEESLNVEEMKTEVAGLQKEKSALDSKVSTLSSEMSKMHMESTARAQLEMLQKEKTTREEQIRRIKSRHEDSLIHLLGHVPSEGLKRKLDDYIREHTQEVQRERSDLQQMKVDLSKKEANRQNVIEQIQKKEQELKGHEEKVFQVCGESQNFDEGIHKLKDKIDQEQDKRGSFYGAKYFLEKYLRRLNEDNPPCPLCHRLFESQDEVEELISEIRDHLNLVPTKLEAAERNLNQYRDKYDKMQQMKPLKTTINDLSEKELPDLKIRLRALNEEIDGLRCVISEKEEDLETKQGDEALAKQIQPDIVMLDRYQVELRDLEKKITVQSSKLSGGDNKRTMQQVNKEKDEAQLNLDMINRKLEGKRQQISDHSERLHQLRSSVNELTSEKLQIENDLQQRIRLEETKAELLNANKEYEQQIKEAREQIQPLKNEMEKLRKKREEITTKKEDHYEEDKSKYDAMREKGRDIMRVHSEIEKYIREGRGAMLTEAQADISDIELKISDLMNENEALSEKINKLRQDLAKQQVRERELSDNLSLRKKVEEIDHVSAQMAELKDKLGKFEVGNLEREMRRLQTKQEELMKEKHTAAGRQSTLEEEIRRFKKELQDDMFRHAEEQYNDKMIIKKTTEMANGDLDKYYKALDRTIFQYHVQKMAEINKIIRDLWRNTYRGNDIETIEIRSDEDESGGAAKSRRVYNYRVVMLKGDTAIDMRGRCSAGQKVLASLIIRLALAEAFCVNCGILALDEPTTNLDRENIESLAVALVEIIKNRAGQMNFQLVVITHDEDFVELLGRSDYVEEFFKVRKDQYGHSQLVKAKVQDLHSR